jgi:hypothetical protein
MPAVWRVGGRVRAAWNWPPAGVSRGRNYFAASSTRMLSPVPAARRRGRRVQRSDSHCPMRIRFRTAGMTAVGGTSWPRSL